MDAVLQEELVGLLEKSKILDVLHRYCRAIDRCDAELLRSVYHPDARDEHGIFSGTGWDFVDFILPMLRGMGPTAHLVNNPIILLDGDVAHTECYVIGYHADVPDENGRMTDLIGGARYADRFEKRAGEWRIAHRQCVFDWNSNQPASNCWDGPLARHWQPRGTKDRTDFSYRMPGFAGLPMQEKRR